MNAGKKEIELGRERRKSVKVEGGGRKVVGCVEEGRVL